MANMKSAKKKSSSGSTLILAVVLTSMLAIIGTLFVMVSRVNRISTSAITQDRELEYAVESIIAKLSEELILDVPGIAGQEYHDYPDTNNATGDAWLASLEPYANDNNTPEITDDDTYYWRQISDVTGFLNDNFRPTSNIGWSISNVEVRPVKDNEEIGLGALDPNGNLYTPLTTDVNPYQFADLLAADADGDGVSDSKWIQLDTTTSKGKPVFAAIRVVDNCGMLNVNTAYKFDPNVGPADANKIDGSSQMQINLLELSRRDEDLSFVNADNYLQTARFGAESINIPAYEKNVVWRYNVPPEGKYTPFDISDELKLRNRYIVNYNKITTRIEGLWDNAYDEPPYTPIDSNLSEWYGNAGSYDYRHISTTYNVDQTIGNTAVPDGNVSPMININKPVWSRSDVNDLYNALENSINPNLDPCMYKMDPEVRWQIQQQYAQLTTNIADFADADANVTAFHRPEDDVNLFFGFEAQPFISEIGFKIDILPKSGRNYYAVELFNPSIRWIDLNDFELELRDYSDPCVLYKIEFNPGHVIEPNGTFLIANRIGAFYKHHDNPKYWKEDPNLVFFRDWIPADERKPPPVALRPERNTPHYVQGPDPRLPPIYIGWGASSDLFLKRKVDTYRDGPRRWVWIYIDKQILDPTHLQAGRESDHYYGRDVRSWHIVYQTIDEDLRHRQQPGRPEWLRGSLGERNSIDPAQFKKYKHRFSFLLPDLFGVTNTKFITVGDAPRILTIGNGIDPDSTVGEALLLRTNESQVRLNLRNPYYRNIFQYLTVFDPRSDGIDNDGDFLTDEAEGEMAVPGRININTAPWYVIAQLPWMTESKARAIVAYRDKLTEPVNYFGGMGRTYAVAIDNQVISLPTYTPPAEGTPAIVKLREDPGFASIGELSFVVAPDVNNNVYEPSMQERGIDGIDLGRGPYDNPYGYPDLTIDGPGLGDGILDDFEERDVIFSRISNLVTVRSDLFTAYILVRIGRDGPQKRAVAILDRSSVTTGRDKVKLVALHYVPDPR